MEAADAGWLDQLTPERPAAVALALLPSGATVTAADPDGVADRVGIDLPAVLRAERPKAEAGSVVAVPVGRGGIDRLLLVGVGDGGVKSRRQAMAAAVRRSGRVDTLVTTLAAGQDGDVVRAVAEAGALAAYRFTDAKSKPPEDSGPSRLLLSGIDGRRVGSALADAAAVADAVSLARDLSNTPSLIKSPQWLAERAVEACRKASVEATVLDEAGLRSQGFGGVLAVGAGSERPPRLLQLSYSPARAGRHLVLVGKGITFDSGGLSLKRPWDVMAPMKTDMAGGAAVIATMTALQALQVKARVTCLVPLAENMPGATATRPGDVIRHWGGLTSEVLNTDAEGRLVLADAIAYAAAALRPDAIVDAATLTGAASVGLGKHHGALYATDPALRDQLLAAADAAGEQLWPMPLVEDYRDSLDSPIADLRNVGLPEKDYHGGSIVAALFLREFTAGLPWAHLDIAGPARSDSDDGEISKGATGFAVRTLLRWLAAAEPGSGLPRGVRRG